MRRSPTEPDFEQLRERMVERQLAARGISSVSVLEAMGRVRREAFVPPAVRAGAYDDAPLPIGLGQTISQPYVVAFMLEALELEPGERVLEIGTGSGYAAAVLAEVAGQVTTVERLEELAERARECLDAEGYGDVRVHCADGSLGWPEGAPYDAILVSAGAPDVPAPLERELGIGGRLLVPIGSVGDQILVRVRRSAPDRFERESLAGVRFVPLVGREGWSG